MSGGSMDYVHGNIEKAARYIQWELANERLRLEKGVLDDVGSYYKENNADKPYIQSPLALKQEVVRRMEDALSTMRKAAVYARAVWCAFRLKGDAAKLIMVFWGIFVFMVCGFEHSIANMSIIGSAMMCGADVTAMEYFKNLSIVTFGNVIGGLMIGMFMYFIERGYRRLW